MKMFIRMLIKIIEEGQTFQWQEEKGQSDEG
jgi:hypothetical protein